MGVYVHMRFLNHPKNFTNLLTVAGVRGVGNGTVGCVHMRIKFLPSNHPKIFTHSLFVTPAHENSKRDFSCAHKPLVAQVGNW